MYNYIYISVHYSSGKFVCPSCKLLFAFRDRTSPIIVPRQLQLVRERSINAINDITHRPEAFLKVLWRNSSFICLTYRDLLLHRLLLLIPIPCNIPFPALVFIIPSTFTIGHERRHIAFRQTWTPTPIVVACEESWENGAWIRVPTENGSKNGFQKSSLIIRSSSPTQGAKGTSNMLLAGDWTNPFEKYTRELDRGEPSQCHSPPQKN